MSERGTLWKIEKRTHNCVVCNEKSASYHYFLFLPYLLLAFQEQFYKIRLFWLLATRAVIRSSCSPICQGHNDMSCELERFLVQHVLNLRDHQACCANLSKGVYIVRFPSAVQVQCKLWKQVLGSRSLFCWCLVWFSAEWGCEWFRWVFPRLFHPTSSAFPMCGTPWCHWWCWLSDWSLQHWMKVVNT